MIQGTTPTIILRLPMESSSIVEAEYTISDDGRTVRTWKLSEMKASGRELRIDLSEDETLKLDAGVYKTQLRVKIPSGKIMASKVIPIIVEDLLSEAVI